MGFYGSRIPPYAERIPLASAIIYKKGDYAIAKIWNEQWGRWSRIAKSTDHASVIQTAINYINNAGGGKLLIKKGEYLINSLISVGNNTIIEGEGQGNTILKRNSNTRGLITNKNTGASGYEGNYNIVIRNLSIDVNGSTYTDSCTPIAFIHSQRILIENVEVYNQTDIWHAIELNGCLL